MMKVSKEEAMKLFEQATDDIVNLIASSKNGIPSGELYAYLMPSGVTYDIYQLMVNHLIKMGRLQQSNYLLTAVPKPATWHKDLDSFVKATGVTIEAQRSKIPVRVVRTK